MKKGIKQLLTISLIILAIVAITIPVKAATTPNITEKPSSSTNKDQYQLEDGTIVIGKSKFTPGVIVTGENAAIAGANDLAIFVADKKTTDGYTYPKMYVYTFGEWYQYVNGKASTKVSKTSADIWYIDNVLKQGLTAPNLEKPAEPVQKYKVFFVDGQTVLSSKEVEKGKTVGTVTIEEKEGYKLAGWIKATAGETNAQQISPENLSKEVINENTVFFAVWKKVVSVDEYIEDTIERLKQNTNVTSILDIHKNEGTINFGITDSGKTTTFQNIVGSHTTLIEELVKALSNEDFAKLEVTYNGTTYTFDKNADQTEVYNQASELLKAITGSDEWITQNLGSLAGKSFTAKVYLNDTIAVLPEGETGEYTVSFNTVLDLDDWVDKLSKAIGTDYFTSTYDKNKEEVNVKVNDRSQKIFEMTDTDVFDALDAVKATNEIKTITLSFENIDEDLVINLAGDINSDEIINWVSEHFAEVFGREITEEYPPYNSDLVGKIVKVTVELADGVQLKDDGTTTREYTVKFTGDDITVTFDHNDKEDPEESTKTPKTLTTPGKITPPENVTREGYVLEGWYVKDKKNADSTDKKFNFENDTVYYNITLEAHWLKVVSVDNEVQFFATAVNTHEQTKGIAKVKFDAESNNLEVTILDNTKTFDNIKTIAGELEEQLIAYVAANVNYVDSISIKEVGKDDEPFEFSTSDLTNDDVETTIKDKIKAFLKAITNTTDDNGNWKEVKLDVLAGREFTVTVKLNTENATQSEEKEDTEAYTVKFFDVIEADKLAQEVISENTISGYKISCTDETVTVTPTTSSQKLSELKGTNTNIIVTAMKLLSDERIEKIVLYYGENQGKSITLKQPLSEVSLKAVSEVATSPADLLEAWLQENWAEICTCGGGECCEDTTDGTCSWESATNNCLINGTKFELEVTLSEGFEFGTEGTRTETYEIKFERDTRKVTVKYDNGSGEQTENIIVDEGLPMSKDAIDVELTTKVDNKDGREYKFKQWAKEAGEEYTFKEPVTEDFTLNAEWYKVFNATNKIQEALSDGDGQIEETGFSTIKDNSGENKFIIGVEDTSSAKVSDLLENTALSQVFKTGLQNEEVEKMTVTYNDKPYDFFIDEEHQEGSNNEKITELFTALTTEPQAVMPARATSDLTTTLDELDFSNLLGKKITVKTVLNEETAVWDEEDDTDTFEVEFEEVLDISTLGTTAMGCINGKTKYVVSVDAQNPKNVTVQYKNSREMLALTSGTGIFDALRTLLDHSTCKETSHTRCNQSNTGVKSIDIIAGGSASGKATLTYADISENNYKSTMTNKILPAVAVKGMEIPYLMKNEDLKNVTLTVKINLMDGYVLKGGIPQEYTISFEAYQAQ